MGDNMNLICIRGAITVYANTQNEILSATRELFQKIIEINNLDKNDLLDVVISATKDLDKVYPAIAIREMGFDIPLFCVQEMYVEGSMPMCLRILLHIKSERSQLKNIYLRKAKMLRPDISNLQISIDGPAGAGKSTVAKEIAKKLNILYLDTGAMYRAVTLNFIENNVDINNEADIKNALKKIKIAFKGENVYLNNADVSENIRSSAVTNRVSLISSLLPVRRYLINLQREIASNSSIVMEGRDIGTNVLPNADLKIYLTSSVDIRTQRRLQELKSKGLGDISYGEIKKQIEKRDYDDKNRAISPLKKALDAVEIDASDLTVDDVVKKILSLLK